jgi:peroxiredoxin
MFPNARHFALAAAVALAHLAPAGAQVDPAARHRLQQAHDTFQAATSLTYHCRAVGVGGFMAMLPEVTAEVVMLKTPTGWQAKVYGTRAAVADLPAANFAVYFNDRMRTWVDDDAKIVYERTVESATSEQVQSAISGSIREFFEPEPFASALACATIIMEAPIKIDGVDCDVILTDPGKDQPKYRWALARSDNLPRQVEHIIQGGGLDMTQRWTLSNLRLNPPVQPGDVNLRRPEGYAFSGGTPQVASPIPSAPPATPITRGPQIGTGVNDLAPEFELAGPDGAKVSLSSLKGSVVVLDFWGTWNAASKRMLPSLQAIYENHHGRGVKVLALAVREADPQNAAAFFKTNKLTFNLLLNADETAKLYKVQSFPRYFVIGKGGQIVYAAGSEATIEAIDEAIERALSGGAEATKTIPPAPAATKPVSEGASEGADGR